MTMFTTAVSHGARSPVSSTPRPNAGTSDAPPAHLTAAQERELESELRRELAALERRLASELQAESVETRVAPTHDTGATTRRSSDTIVRRDVVASALERLASGTYGVCSRCGEPIPFGRLIVMPEATHCFRCSVHA
jgi:DnaK suppressor protein